jgi:hypothetical protein
LNLISVAKVEIKRIKKGTPKRDKYFEGKQAE